MAVGCIDGKVLHRDLDMLPEFFAEIPETTIYRSMRSITQ